MHFLLKTSVLGKEAGPRWSSAHGQSAWRQERDPRPRGALGVGRDHGSPTRNVRNVLLFFVAGTGTFPQHVRFQSVKSGASCVQVARVCHRPSLARTTTVSKSRMPELLGGVRSQDSITEVATRRNMTRKQCILNRTSRLPQGTSTSSD